MLKKVWALLGNKIVRKSFDLPGFSAHMVLLLCVIGIVVHKYDLIILIRLSHLLSAGCAGSGYVSPMKPRARRCTLHQISVTVFAYLPFELLRHSHPVSHADASCKLYITVASFRMIMEFNMSKLKKPDDALICHVL